MFKIGDNVVHLSHGVGVIKSVEEREFNNGLQKFFIVEIEDNGAPKKVFVPVEHAAQRMRKPIDKDAAERVLTILRSKDAPQIDQTTWNRRYREFMEQIHTGDVFKIAGVLRALLDLRHEKDLSFGERKLLDQAKMLVVQELAISKGMPETYIETLIEDACK
jgi:CarD family transcriptional regulator